MNTARSLDQQHAYQTLQQILNDAVKQGKLFAPARDIQGFSHQQHQQQIHFSVQTGAGAYFIKCNDLSHQPQYQAEHTSLLTIIASETLATCAPLAVGAVDDQSYLILQHLSLALHGDWFSAGQQLAQMHQHHSGMGYGFDNTSYCGDTPQDNRWNDNWADFFIDQRLKPLINQLAAQGIHFSQQQACLASAQQLLADHHPAASLLHGDLWSGNIGFNNDKQLPYPMIFDPASYYGDAETDLAMTELFGRLPKKFYDGYQSISAPQDGYQQRRNIYQLYHLLNHALLFGDHYIEQSERMMLDIIAA